MMALSIDAVAPQSVTLTIEDHLDISRGDMLVKTAGNCHGSRRNSRRCCAGYRSRAWTRGGKYLVKHTTRAVKALVPRIDYRVDINTLNHEAADTLKMNDIGRVALKMQQPLVCDAYQRNHATGSFIVIDEVNNNTVAAGMICPAKDYGLIQSILMVLRKGPFVRERC